MKQPWVLSCHYRHVDADGPTAGQARRSAARGNVRTSHLIYYHTHLPDSTFFSSENMKGRDNIIQNVTLPVLKRSTGWIEHFSNKYIICGKLVENDAI